MPEDLVQLLQELDGHLGLAVYRGEAIEPRWREESLVLIRRIRAAIADVTNGGTDG